MEFGGTCCSISIVLLEFLDSELVGSEIIQVPQTIYCLVIEFQAVWACWTGYISDRHGKVWRSWISCMEGA